MLSKKIILTQNLWMIVYEWRKIQIFCSPNYAQYFKCISVLFFSLCQNRPGRHIFLLLFYNLQTLSLSLSSVFQTVRPIRLLHSVHRRRCLRKWRNRSKYVLSVRDSHHRSQARWRDAHGTMTGWFRWDENKC